MDSVWLVYERSIKTRKRQNSTKSILETNRITRKKKALNHISIYNTPLTINQLIVT